MRRSRLSHSAPRMYIAELSRICLWQDYQQNKAESVLEKLYQQKGITYIDFFGDILRGPDGDRYVLYLCRHDDGSWHGDYR